MIVYNYTEIKDKGGWTPLHVAAFKDNDSVISLLLEYFYTNMESKDIYGFNPLHVAVYNGCERACEVLLKCMLLKNETKTLDSKHKTTANSNQLDRKSKVSSIYPSLLKDYQIDINAVTDKGWTALDLALYKGNIKISKNLKEYDAKVK